MSDDAGGATMDLWDWRRRVGDMYRSIGSASDPQAAWAAWRAGRDELLRGHPQSPIDAERRAGFEALRYFPYDPGLRFAVALRPADGPEFTVDAGVDGTIRLRGFARTDGLAEALQAELTLFWVEGYGGGAFLPFGDSTNRGQTYGGGRYLLDTIKGADLGAAASGRTVLDFNYAYNPSCCYSPRYVCPLAPEANRLPVAIRAGEMAYPA